MHVAAVVACFCCCPSVRNALATLQMVLSHAAICIWGPAGHPTLPWLSAICYLPVDKDHPSARVRYGHSGRYPLAFADGFLNGQLVHRGFGYAPSSAGLDLLLDGEDGPVVRDEPGQDGFRLLLAGGRGGSVVRGQARAVEHARHELLVRHGRLQPGLGGAHGELLQRAAQVRQPLVVVMGQLVQSVAEAARAEAGVVVKIFWD